MYTNQHQYAFHNPLITEKYHYEFRLGERMCSVIYFKTWRNKALVSIVGADVMAPSTKPQASTVPNQYLMQQGSLIQNMTFSMISQTKCLIQSWRYLQVIWSQWSQEHRLHCLFIGDKLTPIHQHLPSRLDFDRHWAHHTICFASLSNNGKKKQICRWLGDSSKPSSLWLSCISSTVDRHCCIAKVSVRYTICRWLRHSIPLDGVLVLRHDAVASILDNGSTAFIWKLRYHWLKGVRSL